MATKRITSQEDVAKFPSSTGFKILTQFIEALADSVIGTKLVVSDEEDSPAIQRIASFLGMLSQWTTEIPLDDLKGQRFGNKAFRKWHQQLADASPAWTATLLSDFGLEEYRTESIAAELTSYLLDSFGNPIRIDYGTGHELHFVAWLCCLFRTEVLKEVKDMRVTVNRLFSQYMRLMRTLQSTYSLEPAGSHGVWGLDDYHHLVFLFGGAQLVNNPEGLVPDSVTQRDVVRRYADDYLYFGAIKWILDNKKGPFAEHSQLLYRISGVPTWNKVHTGMIKMYHAEVLSKFPIVQHVLFGTLLPWDQLDADAIQKAD